MGRDGIFYQSIKGITEIPLIVDIQGQGLGRELLINALTRVVRAYQEIGIFAVRVDAIDLQAKEFYLKHEFIPFQDKNLSLFLPMETILREFS